MLKSLVLAFWPAIALLAQDSIHPNLDGFRYPALARSAGIQGTVQFLVTPDGVQLLSGDPPLVAAARANLEKWVLPGSISNALSVTYHFRVTDDIATQVTTRFVEVDEPIGNSFDRFFLRLFHRPVSRKVKVEDCVSAKDSPAEFKTSIRDDLPTVDIDIKVGRSICVQFSTTYALVVSL